MYILQQKPDQHATRFLHLVHVLPSTIRISRSPCIPTFHQSTTELNRVIVPEKRTSDYIPARRLTDLWVPTQFLSPSQPQWKKSHNYRWHATRVNRLIYQYTIDTFNTYLNVPTPRSLTDIGRCYNLGGVAFPHHTTRYSQPMVLRFPLMVSPNLRLSIST
jgi:hypothetical protein